MNYDQFIEKYKPRHNPLSGNDLFETYGDDLQEVKASVRKGKVCTLVDTDNGLYVIDGYHLVNRLNYIITTVEVEEDINVYYED